MDDHVVYNCNQRGYVASYNNNYTEVTINEINGRKEIDLAIFGYTSSELSSQVNIEISYTPAYGGSEQYNFKKYEDHSPNPLVGIGDGNFPFASHMYGKVVFYENNFTTIDPKYNGIYIIKDKNCPRLGELKLILNLN